MKTSPTLLALLCLGLFGASELRAQEDQIHTPGVGSAERTGILDALHLEYTTGSGSKVKFKVNYLKVHNGWAWIKVVPLNPDGEAEGDEWPSLLRLRAGGWSLQHPEEVMDGLDESEGPQTPSKRFVQALKKKYPEMPTDIVPVSR